MEYLVDPDAEVEVCQPLEIDAGLLLRKDHLSWLFGLINLIPEKSNGFRSDLLHFCVTCSRYLTFGEDVMCHRHQPGQGPHQLFPLIRVQSTKHGIAKNYYVSVQALRDIQVPIGDILSHVLAHPRADGMGNGTSRCLYVHPQSSKEEMWLGDMYSGRCAYRECERVFSNRQSHLRLYGITPQFCSISCKLNTWLCCNK